MRDYEKILLFVNEQLGPEDSEEIELDKTPDKGVPGRNKSGLGTPPNQPVAPSVQNLPPQQSKKIPVGREGKIDEEETYELLELGDKDAIITEMKQRIEAGFSNLQIRMQNSSVAFNTISKFVVAGVERFVGRLKTQYDLMGNVGANLMIKDYPILKQFGPMLGKPFYCFATRGGRGVHFTILKPDSMRGNPPISINEGYVYEGNIEEYKKQFILAFFKSYQVWFDGLKKSITRLLEDEDLENNVLYTQMSKFLTQYLFTGVVSFPEGEVTIPQIYRFLLNHQKRDQFKPEDIGMFVNPMDLKEFFRNDYADVDTLSMKVDGARYLLIELPQKFDGFSFVDRELVAAMVEYYNIRLFLLNAQYLIDYFTEGEYIRTGLGGSESGTGLASLLAVQVNELNHVLMPCCVYGIDESTKGEFSAYQIRETHQEGDRGEIAPKQERTILLVEQSLADKLQMNKKNNVKLQLSEEILSKLYKIFYTLNAFGKFKFASTQLEAIFNSVINFAHDPAAKRVSDDTGLTEFSIMFEKVIKDAQNTVREIVSNPQKGKELLKTRTEELKFIVNRYKTFESNIKFTNFSDLEKLSIVIGRQKLEFLYSLLVQKMKSANEKYKLDVRGEATFDKMRGQKLSSEEMPLRKIAIAEPDYFMKQLSSLAGKKSQLYLENKDRKILQDLMKKIVEKKKLEIFCN